MKSLGLDPAALGMSDDVAPLQAAQALGRQMALESRSTASGAGMPGAMSDADREFLVSMNPSISQTPEGRSMIMDFNKKVEQRRIQVAKMARDYAGKKGAIDQGFYDEVQNYADKNPLAPKTATPEEAAKLPPGTTFMTTDGRIMVR